MDLFKYLKQKTKDVSRYIKHDAPRIVAKMARDHAKESFQDEGYTDDTFKKWKEVKRRKEENLAKNKNGSISKRQPRDQRRKILTDTGDLKDSITSEVINSELVEIGTDLKYAEPHNEGTTTAGRNNKVTIPQRQFIGKSKKLEQAIQNKFESDLTKILS